MAGISGRGVESNLEVKHLKNVAASGLNVFIWTISNCFHLYCIHNMYQQTDHTVGSCTIHQVQRRKYSHMTMTRVQV